jgi:hypothetical protein
MELEVKESIADFIDVHIKHNNSDNSIKLTQQRWAKSVVDALDSGNLADKLNLSQG